MTKKIVCFSDIHGQQSKKLTQWFMDNPADILLFAGDIQKNNFDDGKEFIEWLNMLPYKNKVIIFGNHDSNYEYIEEYAREYEEITILNNSSITIDGINIYGSPHSLTFGNWWFQKTEKELKELYRQIPSNTNILITHAPPFGILDKTVRGDLIGSMSLLNKIEELLNLKYNIFGHNHELFGIVKINNVTYINASLLDEKYRLVNMPVIIDY
jgi:Icc-related predicted phosphoesterase